MMERVSIQDLAAILVTKSGLKKKDAERFATAIFEVIKDGLVADRLVKIKGLGTFKIIDIESRESVNVNTGERVLIEGHGKITFTPDATMKELVNKPFSQFETVILNEGVEFNDDMTALAAEAELDAETESVEEPKPEPAEPETPEVDAAEPETALEPESGPQADEPETPVVEEENDSVAAEEDSIQQESEAEEESEENPWEHSDRKIWLWGLAATVLAFVAGFAIGRFTTPTPAVEKTIATVTEQHHDSVAIDTATAAKAKKADVVEKVAEQPAVDYGQQDARVRTGAYRIVGTSQEVKVRAGETTKRISARFLGPDMECYVEAYNGIKSTTELKEGQILKIPKLELKKKKTTNRQNKIEN